MIDSRMQGPACVGEDRCPRDRDEEGAEDDEGREHDERDSSDLCPSLLQDPVHSEHSRPTRRGPLPRGLHKWSVADQAWLLRCGKNRASWAGCAGRKFKNYDLKQLVAELGPAWYRLCVSTPAGGKRR